MTERPEIINALAEQVLAEASLLALERVAQRLQRTVVGSAQARGHGGRLSNSASTASCSMRFSFAHDDVRRAELHELLQAGCCG